LIFRAQRFVACGKSGKSGVGFSGLPVGAGDVELESDKVSLHERFTVFWAEPVARLGLFDLCKVSERGVKVYNRVSDE
jgi:hypothetical protein